MAEAVEAEKPAVLSRVPTTITSGQVIAVILALAACRIASDVLVPLLVAVLGAMALAPIVRALTRVFPRWLASAIVVLGLAGIAGATAWALSDEVAAFSRRLPGLVREVRASIQSASPRQSLLRQLQQAVTELEQTAA